MESEIVALASTYQETECLKDLLSEVPWAKDIVSNMVVHCDIQATLIRAYIKFYYRKSRNIGLRHSFERKLIMDVIMLLTYIS